MRRYRLAAAWTLLHEAHDTVNLIQSQRNQSDSRPIDTTGRAGMYQQLLDKLISWLRPSEHDESVAIAALAPSQTRAWHGAIDALSAHPNFCSSSSSIYSLFNNRLMQSVRELFVDRMKAVREKGNKAFRSGNYEQAVHEYSSMLEMKANTKNLSFPDLHLLLSDRSAAYEKLQEYDTAQEDAHDVINA